MKAVFPSQVIEVTPRLLQPLNIAERMRFTTFSGGLAAQGLTFVINNPDNPVRGLEIITNKPGAAQFFAERMIDVDVPGIVRIVS